MHASRYIYALYIIIGVAALALQSCRKESYPSTPDTTSYAISMSPSEVRGGTRALFNSKADLASFRVNAYKVGTANEQVFDDQLVTLDGTAWAYTPIRYWDKKGSYSFGAYAPADAHGQNGITIDYNYGTKPNHCIMTIPQWQVVDGSETDLIVASSQGAATEYLNQGGVVNLTFDHLYAQLEVQVLRNAFLVSTYKLTSLHYKYVPSDANGTYTHDFATPANSAYTTTILNEDAQSVEIMTGDVEVDPTPKSETTFKHMVVPFTSIDGGFEIVVGYTVEGTAKTATVASGLKTLEAGQRYVLRLNFNSGADIVPSLTVEDWIPEELDEDDKYNW